MERHRAKVSLGLCAGAALAGATAKAVPPAGYPTVMLSNGLVTVVVCLPDTARGYYRGVRFEGSGIMTSGVFRGHEYFAPLHAKHDPLWADCVAGPAEEFDLDTPPPGYAEAKPGATFLKIGVGLLERPDAKDYQFMRAYPVRDGGVWTVETGPAAAKFTHVLMATNGSPWGYRYTKHVVLPEGRAEMRLEHTLVNTGRRAIHTLHYNHSMFRIDGRPIGRGYRLVFPFAPALAEQHGDALAVEGRALTVLPPELTASQWVRLTGYGATAADTDVLLECAPAGASLRLSVDRPLARLCVYAEASVLCPEPFVALDLAPGATEHWTTTLRFEADAERP